MARKENDLTCFGLTQYLDPEYWNWTDEELKAISVRDAEAIGKIIKAKLEAAGHPLDEIYIVKHDKDVREVWSEINMRMVIEQKPEHVHAVCRFEKGKGATIDQIATAIGVAPQYVEKAKRGKFGYDNMLAYLCHIKYPDKYQYAPDEVKAVCGRPYTSIYEERKNEWIKGRAKLQVEKAHADIDWLESMVLDGQVTKNQLLLTDEYYSIYARNKRRLDDALDSYAQRKIYKTMQAMENGEFKLSVFFITGNAGSGKSMFTEAVAKRIQERAKEETGETWTICTVAANNPFDEYMGDEILIMDDLRGLSLGASDWLKLLDNDRVNVGSARYRNKKIACRTILINSEKDVVEFFYYLKDGNGSEAMDQFIRRLLARVVVLRPPFSEDRTFRLSRREEVDAYNVQAPDCRNLLSLHHGFKRDITVGEAQAVDYIADKVMERNGYTDNMSSATDIIETCMDEDQRREAEDKMSAENDAEIQAELEAEEKSLAELSAEIDAKVQAELELQFADQSMKYKAEDRQYHLPPTICKGEDR